MPLQRMIMDVYLAPIGEDGAPDFDAEPIAHEGLLVLLQDQMRGELEGSKHGIQMKRQPIAAHVCWVWAALTRTKLIADDFQTFKRRAIAVQGEEGGVEAVDPTQPDLPSGSDSSWPGTLVNPGSG